MAGGGDYSRFAIYPVPQNAPHVSAGMNPVPTPLRENYTLSNQPGWNGVNVLELPKGQRPKATDVSPWYGVYLQALRSRLTASSERVNIARGYNG